MWLICRWGKLSTAVRTSDPVYNLDGKSERACNNWKHCIAIIVSSFSLLTQDKRTNDTEAAIVETISRVISAGCNCSFPEAALQGGLFSCWNGPTEVTYRNSIVSTDNTSKLVGYIEDWVKSEQPFIQVGRFLVKVFQDCPVRKSSVNDPECELPAAGGPSVIASSDPVVIGCLNRCIHMLTGETLCLSP